MQDIKKPYGTPAKGIELDFRVQREDWNEYKLSDGTVLRVKNSLIKAFQVVDENGEPKLNEDGEPEDPQTAHNYGG